MFFFFSFCISVLPYSRLECGIAITFVRSCSICNLLVVGLSINDIMTCTSCLTYCIIYCFPRPQSDSGMFVEHHGYSFFRSKYCSAICYQHFPEIHTTTTPHWTAFDLLQLCGFYFSFSLSFSFSKLGRLNCFLPVFDRILNIYISIYFDSFSSSSHFTLNHTFG